MKKPGSVEKEIEAILQKRFKPVELVIIDESHKHAGHVGAPTGASRIFELRLQRMNLPA